MGDVARTNTAQDAGQPLQVASVRQLAAVLGVSKTTAAKLAKEPWFPPRADSDGSWSVVAVKKAMAERAEREPKKTSAAPSAPSAPSPPTVQPHAGQTNPLIAAGEERARRAAASIASDDEVLAEPKDPLEVARAAMRVASRRLAAPGGDPSEKLDDLKRALEELRRCEAGYLELAKEQGKLIERDAAKACMGMVGSRFVRSLERLEGRFSAQVEAWLAESKFRELTAEERARRVRAWVIEQTQGARSVEEDELEKMVKAELADRKGT